MTTTLPGKQVPEWQFKFVMAGLILSLLLVFIGCVSLNTFFQIGAVTGFLFGGIGAMLLFVEQSIIGRLIVGGLFIVCACLLAYRFF